MTRGTGALVINTVGTIMAYPLGWPSSPRTTEEQTWDGPTEPHHVYPLGWSLVQDDDVEGMRTRTLYFL